MENVHSDVRVKKVDGHNFVPRGFSVFKMAVFLKIRGRLGTKVCRTLGTGFLENQMFSSFHQGLFFIYCV